MSTENNLSIDFFHNLDSVVSQAAEPKKFKSRSKDELERARDGFIKGAEKAATEIEAGEKKGSWFVVQSDGRIKITLRSSNRVVEIKGKAHWYLPSIEAACEFLAKARHSARLGQFDVYLKKMLELPRSTTDKYLSQIVVRAAQAEEESAS